MKIAINLRTLTFGASGGLAWWLKGTLEELFRIDERNEYLLFGMPYSLNLIDAEVPNVRRYAHSAAMGESQMRERLEFEKDVAVIFHVGVGEKHECMPFHREVYCLLDVPKDDWPTDPDERRRQHAHQGMAGALVVPTEAMKRRLQASPWTHAEVCVVPPATMLLAELPETTEQVSAVLPDAAYFLYPGNLYPEKNHRAILQAFARFSKDNPEMHFAFTGYSDGWDTIKTECKRLPVHHLGLLAPRLLAAVYRRAHALVYLPLGNPIGLPILEAFAADVPVLCSDLPETTEVGGDAVLRADACDVELMAAAMSRIANENHLRQQLRERGRERIKGYSWRRSAEVFREVLEHVGKSSTPRVWATGNGPPLVSVVTPSFNQGRFIRATIESVLTQNYPHLDFRVVDGGSTDETIEILKSYGDRFPWVSEKDRGQTHAINKGLEQARGEIQTYLNSDDVLRPGAIARVVDHFQRHPACDLVYGRDANLDINGEFLRWFPTRPYSFETLIENCCIAQPAAFWRSRIAKVAGPFDESLYSIMDYEYWMRLDRAGGTIEHIPDLLASSLMHADAKTSGGTDYLTRRFGEMFIRSMKHAGYFSDTNLYDYMHSCVFPTRPWLRKFPKLASEAVRAWWTYRHFQNRPFAWAALRTAMRLVFHSFRVQKISPLENNRYKFRHHQADNIEHPPAPRWGPRLHNLLGTRVVVSAGMERGSDELWLTGRPLCDMTLSVKAGERTLVELPMRARELTSLRLPCDQVPGDVNTLTLEFSRSVRCPVRGEASFELLGTNLFGERYHG